MTLKIFVLLAALALTRAQRRYYSLEDMPETNFDCRDKILGGYYADPEANCQMFHVCVKIPGQGVQDFRFLCPNETSFDQENQICADSGDIDCTGSGLYLENFDLYRIGSAAAKRPLPQVGSAKVTAIPLGPSTKSPLLTNNVYEDDDFYLQKSESGDRRLHSKDILRGSSSSNFFNNRNNGKDLEDDDDDSAVRKPENVNNQFKSRPSFQNRPKTQYQSQFRKVEPTTQAPTIKQQVIENRNQITDKKRTKIAVRKLARKRPEEEVENRPAQQVQQQPGFSTITTQVTQKFGFNDANVRYNTVNRQSTTPSTVATSEVFRQPQQSQQPQQQPPQPQQPQQFPQKPQQFPQQPQQFPQQQPQQRFQNFRRNEQQTTPAFFEPNPTTQPGSKDSTSFSLLRNPIVAAGPNYNQQNRGSTDFQQNRQTTANYPSPVSNANLPSSQQNRQTTTGIPTNFPQQRPLQQNRPQAPINNGNFQQQQNGQQVPVNNGNFQQQQQSRQVTVNNGNFQQQQQSRQQVPVNNGNFQQQTRQQNGNGNFQQQGRQPPQTFNGNFQQQQQQQPQVNANSQQNNYNQNRQQVSSANFQQNRLQQQQQQQQPTTGVPNRGQNGQQAFNGFNRQQNYNAQQNFNDQQNFNGQSQSRQNIQRQSINRNFDEFEEGDNQEFLKTAPSNNYRPSDLNSFNTNNYKQEAKSNNTRFVQTSTTKYITPTIITTPKTQNFDSSSTIKQNYFSAQQLTTNYYTPTVSTTQRIQSTGSSALPQNSYSSPQPAKPAKDAAYDYAYYDDAGSFSEYDSVDHLGDSDFSRTSQRAKYRLI